MANKHRGMTRVIRAAGYSWQGLRQTFRQEAAFRQELGLCLVLMPFSWWLADSLVMWLLLATSLLLILICELLNSAIEAVVDRIGEELHPLSGQAKDMGSAAVFLSLFLAACVWGSCLYLKLFG
ncbi:diacylglycerol kinase [Pokkaliibacter plantistimulans]|uniref:Diacylglycerol kinase n=2 Tax=Pseudomonadota TaxID=1224 RepID=A0ABX5M2H5_9GAMM|nr:MULTISPECIES: diacylglycerol kinase [Pokkaliibacter]MDH2432276.1 diacylglycerol kinase [Pokkaliibacter sp. MBI-7]PPC74467.1 diacylglycerol kinase [Pokkaliibacter plantistimulans]PXF33099.1 diacylglycerol kinase [Pokkaliibacter plantistimulans]